jgi:hypothetical protein
MSVIAVRLPSVYMILIYIGLPDSLLVRKYRVRFPMRRSVHLSLSFSIPLSIGLPVDLYLSPPVRLPVCPVRLFARSAGLLSVSLLSKRFSPRLPIFLSYSNFSLCPFVCLFDGAIGRLCTVSNTLPSPIRLIFTHLSVFWLSFTSVRLSVCPHTSYFIHLLTDSSSPLPVSTSVQSIHLFIVYPSVFPSGCNFFLIARLPIQFLIA